MNYECHITVPTEFASQATEVAKWKHWKTSEIARDPVLGDRNFFYLTSHSADIQTVFTRMNAAVNELKLLGVPVLREKIELIIHDTKAAK